MNWRKLRVKDIFSLLKIKVFLVGTYLQKTKPWLLRLEIKFLKWGGETVLVQRLLKHLQGYVASDISEPIIESSDLSEPNIEGSGLSEIDRAFNIVYRYLTCEQPCMKNGSCVHCGCTTPDNILPEKNYCSKYKWGAMEPDFINYLDKLGKKILITNKNSQE